MRRYGSLIGGAMSDLRDDLKQAEQRLELLRKGESRTHSVEEVERILQINSAVRQEDEKKAPSESKG